MFTGGNHFQGLLTASSAASRVIQSLPHRGSRQQTRESYQVISGTSGRQLIQFFRRIDRATVRQPVDCHIAVVKPHKDHLGTKRTYRQQRDHPVTRRFTRGSGTYRYGYGYRHRFFNGKNIRLKQDGQSLEGCQETRGQSNQKGHHNGEAHGVHGRSRASNQGSSR